MGDHRFEVQIHRFENKEEAHCDPYQPTPEPFRLEGEHPGAAPESARDAWERFFMMVAKYTVFAVRTVISRTLA